jgi:hypothetical protein
MSAAAETPATSIVNVTALMLMLTSLFFLRLRSASVSVLVSAAPLLLLDSSVNQPYSDCRLRLPGDRERGKQPRRQRQRR